MNRQYCTYTHTKVHICAQGWNFGYVAGHTTANVFNQWLTFRAEYKNVYGVRLSAAIAAPARRRAKSHPNVGWGWGQGGGQRRYTCSHREVCSSTGVRVWKRVVSSVYPHPCSSGGVGATTPEGKRQLQGGRTGHFGARPNGILGELCGSDWVSSSLNSEEN